MPATFYQRGELFIEDVAVQSIAASYGTPCYAYSRKALEEAYHRFSDPWQQSSHTICYAVKACSNISILKLLANLGAGFDIVSGGELERVILAGGTPDKIFFSGVGKTPDEIIQALQLGIACFNVESEEELFTLERLAAELGVRAPISLRVNPDVDPKTHPYIATGLRESKFGIEMEEAPALYEYAAASTSLEVVGLDCHIGSQITELSPFTEAFQLLLALADDLAARGIKLSHLDVGGGVGVTYQDEEPVSIEAYAASIQQMLGRRPYHLVFEPGRFIVANAGCLITQVTYLKENHGRKFAVVDAAMNDLIRPALYNAWQEVRPVVESIDGKNGIYDIVGPVCESGDFLAKERELNLQGGDLLSIESAGAYGIVMSSNYNSRNRPPEILISGDEMMQIRQRETIADQLRLETLVDF